MSETMVGAFAEATARCCERFLDEEVHNQGRSPLVHGPCGECIREVVDELDRESARD